MKTNINQSRPHEEMVWETYRKWESHDKSKVNFTIFLVLLGLAFLVRRRMKIETHIYTFFLSLLFLAASLFCASLLSVLASEALGPSCWLFDVDGVPLPMAAPLLLPSLWRRRRRRQWHGHASARCSVLCVYIRTDGQVSELTLTPAAGLPPSLFVLDGWFDGSGCCCCCLDGPAPAAFDAVLSLVPMDPCYKFDRLEFQTENNRKKLKCMHPIKHHIYASCIQADE